MHKKKTKAPIFIVAACMLAVSMIVLAIPTFVIDHSEGDAASRPVPSTYHKDVDCTITDIDARWIIYFWQVDLSYENAEYGLSGKQTLTGGDAAQFKDAQEGDHISAIMFSSVDNKTGEVVDRRLGDVVVSAGFDEEAARLR